MKNGHGDKMTRGHGDFFLCVSVSPRLPVSVV